MVSVLVPLAYVVFLVGSLLVFSRVWNKRQKAKAHHEQWFPQHTTRDIYVSLLSLDPPPARPVLIAALIRRAMTDVDRIKVIQEGEPALKQLLEKGQIGDDTWNHFLETKKDLEAELYEVVGEANTFREGWGNIIIAHASDMIQHQKNKDVFDEMEQAREQARAIYSKPPPAYAPPPVLGIAAANPKKRTLPASVPTNAQIPASKPGTPQPPKGSSQPQTPAPVKQSGTPETPAQQTPLRPIQATNGNAQTPSPQKSASPVKVNGTATPNGINGRSSPNKVSPVKAGKAKDSPIANGSPEVRAHAPSLHQTLSSMSTTTGSSGGDSDADDGDDDEGVKSGTSSSVTSPNKKTPSKKKKNKGKKGKK